LVAASARAATLTVSVVSESGRPVTDAVVMLAGAVPLQMAAPELRATMIQENQQFSPFVLPVRVGTTVEFPNLDPFRHHVYSFSAAKPFELKLYGGGETQEVLFDKPGPVALGCNIHDNMLAYVYVVAAPFFAKSDAQGRAVIYDLPPGAYTLTAWHPDQRGAPDATATDVTVGPEGDGEARVTVALKRERRQRRPGAFDESGY
jgi:plastocyanin